ncbi:hypothetical protein [Sphingomonas solaris]|uniref:Copper resistance protein D domain-containing protein n=1 Tax=Alterirhizorhabdus solaris TaxID=2529389 RepID=A0A558RAY8_9SPHN|nr:hypothetical protein [Sphingomonas solaris]TVV76565.1 hypothetical protein FOY91_04035 [Sphingomonas solaris]
MVVALLTLLHVLVFVYWLGGDLGAFYTSGFMTDPKRSVAERMMAVKILNNIDMAPRTTLILAYPTGLALAWAKGWVDVSGLIPALMAVLFVGWLALAWAVHLQHGGGGAIRKLDLAIRYLCVTAFGLAGIAGLAGLREMPFFIAVKLCLLAGCVALGLVVRRQLVPLFGAIREMTATGPTAETDATIRQVNNRARVSVITIWVLVGLAAYLGIATPA